MQSDKVAELVSSAIQDAQVHIEDLTGGGDHFRVWVISSVFRGKTLIEQHQLVHAALQGALDDGSIHAVQIKTETPEARSKTSAP